MTHIFLIFDGILLLYFFLAIQSEPANVLARVCVCVSDCESYVYPPRFEEWPMSQTMLREPLELRLRVRGMVWWSGIGESGGQNW